MRRHRLAPLSLGCQRMEEDDEEEGEGEESEMGWINLKAGWSALDKLG